MPFANHSENELFAKGMTAAISGSVLFALSFSSITRCSKVLGVSVELLVESELRAAQRERSYEYGLPNYLQHDLDAYKEGLAHGSDLMDCLWGELYGSINMAEVSDGAITPEHADYLRQKYLWRTQQ